MAQFSLANTFSRPGQLDWRLGKALNSVHEFVSTPRTLHWPGQALWSPNSLNFWTVLKQLASVTADACRNPELSLHPFPF